MMMTRKTLIIFGLLIITSCTQRTKSFYNTEKLNAEVEKKIDVNLKAIKSKIDSNYKADSSFYVESIYEVGNGGESKFYQLLGLIQKNSKGDSITIDQVESFKKKMLLALKKSIEIEGCKTANDSICIWKSKVVDWTDESTKERQVYLHYPQLADDFYGLYKKGNLNKEEFEFFTVYLYVLTSIDAIDNNKPKI